MTDQNSPNIGNTKLNDKPATPAVTMTSDASRRAADNAQQAGRAASEATGRTAEVVAHVARQSSQAGADALRRASEGAAETMRRGTQAMAEGQRQIAEDATERYQATSRKIADVARSTSEDMSRWFTLPSAAEGGLRDMQQSLAGLVEGVVHTNLRATQELLRLSDPAAMIELQQRFMRDYLDALMQGTATLVHAIRRTADETLRPLEEQVEQRKQAQLREHGAQKAA